jgi:hypothetical protein
MNVPRYTRHLTIKVHQEGASVSECSAIEEAVDGSPVFVTDDVLWDQTDSGVTMTVTRDYLCPNQALTLKWEI